MFGRRFYVPKQFINVSANVSHLQKQSFHYVHECLQNPLLQIRVMSGRNPGLAWACVLWWEHEMAWGMQTQESQLWATWGRWVSESWWSVGSMGVAARKRVKVEGVCLKRMHALAIFAKSRQAGRQKEHRWENSVDLRRRSGCIGKRGCNRG